MKLCSHLLVLIFLTAFNGVLTSQSRLYWSESDNNVVRRINLDGTNNQAIISSENTPRQLVADLANNQLFYTDGHLDGIKTSELDGSNLVTIYSASEPIGLEMDISNNHIYFSDVGTNTIERINRDGTGNTTIVSGLQNPADLAIDLDEGKIYWYEVDIDKIKRANLDGSNIEEVLTYDLVRFDIDPVNDKIYFTDRPNDKIVKCDLDGSNLEDVVTNTGELLKGIKVDNTNEKIYWVENLGSIRSADLDGSNVQTLVPSAGDVGGIALEQVVPLVQEDALARIEGNIFIEQIDKGVIMRSPNGKCWLIRVGDDGSLSSQQVQCP